MIPHAVEERTWGQTESVSAFTEAGRPSFQSTRLQLQLKGCLFHTSYLNTPMVLNLFTIEGGFVMKRGIYLLLFALMLGITSCGTGTGGFVYPDSIRFELKKLQYALELSSEKVPLTGGPVYVAESSSSQRSTSKESNAGKGRYAEQETTRTHRKEIKIPIGTPGVYAGRRSVDSYGTTNHEIDIDFGEGVILTFRSWGTRKNPKPYVLWTQVLVVDGVSYTYDGLGQTEFVLWADVDLDKSSEEIETRERKKVPGKTLEPQR
jgi:hypothetical protein